jgi:hypothetical protein
MPACQVVEVRFLTRPHRFVFIRSIKSPLLACGRVLVQVSMLSLYYTLGNHLALVERKFSAPVVTRI